MTNQQKTDPEKGGDPPETAAAPSTTNNGPTTSSKTWIVVVIALLGVTALAVGLGVGLTRDNKKTSSTSVSQSAIFRSSGKALDMEMRLFTTAILEGYSDIEELKDDLNNTARFYISSFIEQQIRYNSRYPFVPEEQGPVFSDQEDSAADSISMDEGAGGGVSAEGQTDFETNNQVDGVDEADRVKSDGTNVYAAYGDVLVVWDAISGESVTNYTLPAIDNQKDTPGAPQEDFVDIDYYYMPKPNIQGMNLEDGHIILYVSGYGQEARASATEECPFYDCFETRIIVLDTTTFEIVGQDDVHGYYRDARSVGGSIHIVSVAGLNYYALTEGLERWNDQYQGLDDEAYRQAAAAKAEALIDPFVDKLAASLPLNIPKISIWQSDLGENENLLDNLYQNGFVQSFLNVHSLSVSSLTNSGGLALERAGAFMPTTWGYTYVTDGYLLFAAQGWNWSSERQGSVEKTYFLGFSLNNQFASPSVIGDVDGTLLNQYSIDIHEGHIRCATTSNQFWPLVDPVPSEPLFQDDVDIDVTVDEPRPVEPEPQPRFTTENQVIILKIPTSADEVLEEVGRIDNLGKEGESFTAFRFFGDIAYAVTFLRTDPFYALDLTPEAPSVLGELEISGFSEYLHSINTDDTLLLAVGQEADDFGVVLGLQVTLFDASDPENPTDIQRVVIEQERDAWSSSSVAWDFKAFRYLPLNRVPGQEEGRLILPLRVNRWDQGPEGNFDGFFVYHVNRNGIEKLFEISHVDSELMFGGCYYNAQLAERSLVFSGDVMTLKGHSVVMTDLDTGEERWRNEMVKPENRDACVYW